MNYDISKLCADFLRTSFESQTEAKLKASHARELVAAFFGYKSHAALISEKKYPLNDLEEAAVLVPDIPLLDVRRGCLQELPDDLPPSQKLASLISSFLVDERYFVGDVWLHESLENYVTEVLLFESDSLVSDGISDAMASTNAEFSDLPYYKDARIIDSEENMEIIVSGTLKGTQLDDKMFSGDTIDFGVRVILPRIAGKRGFLDFEIEAGGSVNDDWRDEEMHYEVPNVRPKEQWLQMTGGFRIGETLEQFQNRQSEIHAIRNRIAKGKAGVKDVDRLSHLMGANDEDEPLGDLF